MLSPPTMPLSAFKGLCFGLTCIWLSMVLVACQTQPALQSECENGGRLDASKTGCREKRERNKTKQRYSQQFKVDPHAGHKAVERITITTAVKWTGEKHNKDLGRVSGNEPGAASELESGTIIGATTGEVLDGTKRAVNKRESVRTVRFSIKNPDHKYRHYVHSVISPNLHAPRSTRYEEKPGYPRLRTGSIQFDALFALALNEMRASQLSRSSDSDYQNGTSQSCVCFGDKNSAHFLALPVLAFSGYLGLSALNAERMENSLLFQLSSYRDGLAPPNVVPGIGNGLQIIQRAGKYGSWPVYSDRVLWALAAEKTLNSLAENSQAAFSKSAYHALKNTIEIDRVSIFDGADGLYIGAYSTHSSSTTSSHSAGLNGDNPIDRATELAAIKNLVVNLGYYKALKFAADLAQSQHDVVSSVKYSDWAVDLKHAINQKFWIEAEGLYRPQYSPSYFTDVAPQVEWWVQVFAVNVGVAENRERDIIMAHVPTFDDIATPFHAALSLRAAAKAKYASTANFAYRRLIDKVSTQMSNQKVFEAVRGATQAYSNNGNLLSVSAYGSMIIDTLFGVEVSKRGLRFNPFITQALRVTQFSGQRSISLMDLRLQQKKFAIKIIFPSSEQQSKKPDGYYSISSVEVNGESVSGIVGWPRMNASNKVVIKLGKLIEKRETQRAKAREKKIESKAHITKSTASSRQGHEPETKPLPMSRNRIEISMSDPRVHIQSPDSHVKGQGASAYLSDWGALDDRLRIEKIEINHAGFYTIQLQYRNPAAESSGIANAVKWMTIHDHNGNEYGAKIIGMPLTSLSSGEQGWQYSVPVTLHLNPGKYQIDLEDFLNMSYLKANMTYNGKGGHSGFSNRADIKGIRITSLR